MARLVFCSAVLAGFAVQLLATLTSAKALA